MADSITGKTFGRLTVLAHDHTTNGRTYWQCRCTCGSEKIVQRAHLVTGSTVSCGCIRRERMQSGEVQKLSRRNRTHGMAHSREYKSWEKMRERCSNSNTKAWQWYGGKGIRVCQPWQDSFEAFYRDMGPRPEGCEIDRIDPSGNYEPLNCRWLPRLENGLRAFRKDKVSANG